jgi:hypothetical protein
MNVRIISGGWRAGESWRWEITLWQEVHFAPARDQTEVSGKEQRGMAAKRRKRHKKEWTGDDAYFLRLLRLFAANPFSFPLA